MSAPEVASFFGPPYSAPTIRQGWLLAAGAAVGCSGALVGSGGLLLERFGPLWTVGVLAVALLGLGAWATTSRDLRLATGD